MQHLTSKFDISKFYSLREIFTMLCSSSSLKFDESIDVIITLRIDTKQLNNVVKGCTFLPHGTGKNVSIAVFAQGKNAEIAKQAGASIVGMEDLAASIKKGSIHFDTVVATPDTMNIVNNLAPILGPKGLMPNVKFGTLTEDIASSLSNIKTGQVTYRMDKTGVVKTTVGKVSFTIDDLVSNFNVLLNDMKKLISSVSNAPLLKRIIISSTMGLPFNLDMSNFKL
jgi:large subunit ribosomal protein L1